MEQCLDIQISRFMHGIYSYEFRVWNFIAVYRWHFLYCWEIYARSHSIWQLNAIRLLFVTPSGIENRIMVMSCWHLAMASLSLVWTTEVAWGHAGSLIYRLNLSTHCHKGHEWACYPAWRSASHLCPSLASLQSAATQWGHSSRSPVGHGFHLNIRLKGSSSVC